MTGNHMAMWDFMLIKITSVLVGHVSIKPNTSTILHTGA